MINFPRQRALNLKNLRQSHAYRPFVLYDVFPVTLKPRSGRIIGSESLTNEKSKRIIYADFHYSVLEESA